MHSAYQLLHSSAKEATNGYPVPSLREHGRAGVPLLQENVARAWLGAYASVSFHSASSAAKSLWRQSRQSRFFTQATQQVIKHAVEIPSCGAQNTVAQALSRWLWKAWPFHGTKTSPASVKPAQVRLVVVVGADMLLLLLLLLLWLLLLLLLL